MKKIIYAVSSVSLLSLALAGCGWQGVDSTTRYVSTGVGYGVTPVVNTVGSGVTILTGYPATQQDVVIYKKKGVVYRNGHTYTISHGRYVLVR